MVFPIVAAPYAPEAMARSASVLTSSAVIPFAILSAIRVFITRKSSVVFLMASPNTSMSLVARALFGKGKEPRYVFQALISMLPEATFSFTADGITLKALDPSKVALLELNFAAGGMEEYYVDHDVKIGLLFSTLKNAIKRVGAAEKLEMGVDEERQRFVMTIYPKKGKEQPGIIRRFSFPIVQLAEEEVPKINVEYDASFEMDASTFDDTVAMVGEVSDAVSIKVAEGSVAFRAVGEGGREAYAEFGQESEALYEVSGAASAKYTAELIRNISSAMKGVAKRVRVELGEGKPMRMTYEFASGAFYIILAPRSD